MFFAGLIGILAGSGVTVVLILMAFRMWTSFHAGAMAAVLGTFGVFIVGAFIYAMSQNHDMLTRFSTAVANAILP